ncbi:MAG: holo-ACP synthase [bacterium]
MQKKSTVFPDFSLSNLSPLSSPLSPAFLGIGLDIVEVKRIKKLIRKSRTFLSRVFTEEELRYCLGKKNQYRRLAVRFAAKEAVWKAAGLKGMPLRNISIVKAPGGRPGVMIKAAGRRFSGLAIQISLSHSDDYAAAVAVAIKR